MARQYGESFERPVDPFTGLPYPGVPEMVRLNTNRPSGAGVVVLRDPSPPPPDDSPMGAARVTG